MVVVAGAVLASAALLFGSAATPARASTAPHNPVGYLDAASFSTGQLSAAGWAADPDSTGPVQVTGYLDGRQVGVVSAHQSRPDVAKVYPRYGSMRGWTMRVTIPDGTHRFCAYALNLGPGATTPLGCRPVTADNTPKGAFSALSRVPGAVQATGWALDPNVSGADQLRLSIDGGTPQVIQANLPTTSLPAGTPAWYGQLHGFVATLPVSTAGVHNVCAVAVNLGAGSHDTSLGCRGITVAIAPVGALRTVTRIDQSQVTVAGWSLDPDTTAPIQVTVSVGSSSPTQLLANAATSSVPTVYAAWGGGHGFTAQLPAPATAGTVCLSAVDVSRTGVATGGTTAIGCLPLAAAPTVPPPTLPTGLTVHAGSTTAQLNWTLPAPGSSFPITGWLVSTSPSTTTQTLPATTAGTTVVGLTPARAYTFQVAAITGSGAQTSPATVSASTQSVPIPPQTTPAPVSTSRYLRSLTGVATHDTSMMRAWGATDAGYNPSGHQYLILLDIGGQVQSSGGVMLSATSQYLSYPQLVTAVDAYLDGYASTEKTSAPLMLAIGTNNDIDVNASTGAAWAQQVINPIAAHAAQLHPASSITLAGADDAEPGFSGTASQTRSWLTGYLASTSAPFVFNGSADGCPISRPTGSCNNGWTETDLQWLAGGAAPNRIISLPQIYNTDMPHQWQNISLTGTSAGHSKLFFGGPLTEWSACSQAGGCGSLTNVTAWSALFNALSSSTATAQPAMPYGTDLLIS